MKSDGAVLENGTLNTKAGALLTTDGVLDTSRVREVNGTAEQDQRTARKAEAARRRGAPEEEAAERVRVKEETRRAQINLAVLLENRGLREMTRAQSRGLWRWISRQRALCTSRLR